MKFNGNDKAFQVFRELVQQFDSEEKVEHVEEKDDAFVFKESEDTFYITEPEGQTKEYKKFTTPGLLLDEAYKIIFYQFLKDYYKRRLDWGILTGVKPVKLYKKLEDHHFDPNETLKNDYLLSQDKIDLLSEIHSHQKPVLDRYSGKNHLSLYLGIPICPSRCSYCSFVSTILDRKRLLLTDYLKELEKEIILTGELLQSYNINIDSIYIGGGTPSILNPDEAEKLIHLLYNNFDFSNCKEFTFEAGRADTTTPELLYALKENHVDRLCLNPQSMNQSTCNRIGRSIRVEDIYSTYQIARDLKFDSINMDLICGLEGEDQNAFLNSLEKVLELKPDNLTVHDLSIKRGSRLHEESGLKINKTFSNAFFKDVFNRIKENDYFPYYMYRQKYTIGNGENIGYSLEDKESIYNILMMAEQQTILGLGAGSSGKLYEPETDRFSHVFTVKDVRTYNQRSDEIIQKKLDSYQSFFKN